MIHPISPTQFRLGKSFPWRNNVIISSTKSKALTSPNDLNFPLGIERLGQYLFLQYNIYMVRCGIKFCEKTSRTKLRLLYVPKIKRRSDVYESFMEGYMSTVASFGEQKGGMYTRSYFYVDQETAEHKAGFQHVYHALANKSFNASLAARFFMGSQFIGASNSTQQQIQSNTFNQISFTQGLPSIKKIKTKARLKLSLIHQAARRIKMKKKKKKLTSLLNNTQRSPYSNKII